MAPQAKKPKNAPPPLLPRRGARLKGWKPRCPSTVSFYRKGQRLRRSSSQDIQYCVVLAPCHCRFAAKAPALLQRGFHPGAARPQDPQRRSRIEKTGKNAWKDYFSIGSSDSPLLIRVCPNPRGGKLLCKKGMVRRPCLFWLEFLFRSFTGNKVGVSLPTFFAKKVGPCLCGRGHGIIRAIQDRRRALGPRRFAPKEVAS